MTSGVVDRGRGAAASRSADPEERSREAASTAIVGTQRRRRPSSASIKKWAIRTGVVVVAALAVFFAVRVYLDRQWYVGESNGNVAVFQGIPATIGGFHFSHVELETDIPVSEVARLPQYPALSEGITANDRTEAMADRRADPAGPERRRRRAREPRRLDRAGAARLQRHLAPAPGARRRHRRVRAGRARQARTGAAEHRAVRLPDRRGVLRGVVRGADVRSSRRSRLAPHGRAPVLARVRGDLAAAAGPGRRAGHLGGRRARRVRADARPRPRRPDARRLHVHDRTGRAGAAAAPDRARASGTTINGARLWVEIGPLHVPAGRVRQGPDRRSSWRRTWRTSGSCSPRGRAGSRCRARRTWARC